PRRDVVLLVAVGRARVRADIDTAHDDIGAVAAEPVDPDAGACADVDHAAQRIPPEGDEVHDRVDRVRDVIGAVEALPIRVVPLEVRGVELITSHAYLSEARPAWRRARAVRRTACLWSGPRARHVRL